MRETLEGRLKYFTNAYAALAWARHKEMSLDSCIAITEKLILLLRASLDTMECCKVFD